MNEIFIGETLKKLRKEKRFTLVELAKLTGIQIATLSRIQNNKMTGTVQAHLKIAYILGVDITELYKDLDECIQKNKVHINKEAPEIITISNASYQNLINESSSKLMQPTLITLKEKGKTAIEKFKQNTEMFVYVLEGSIELIINKDSYNLNRGNASYFNASLTHHFRNIGNSTAQLLTVRSK